MFSVERTDQARYGTIIKVRLHHERLKNSPIQFKTNLKKVAETYLSIAPIISVTVAPRAS